MKSRFDDMQELIHPAANILPDMSDEEYARLKESIAKNGVMEPVRFYEGLIADGRHRHLAATELSVPYERDDVDLPDGDIVRYVLALNRDRRHLTVSQLAMVAVSAGEYYREQRVLQKKRSDAPWQMKHGKASKNLAKKLGIGSRMVERANQVKRSGSERLQDAVSEGVISVHVAAKLLDLGLEEQDQLVELGPQAIKAAVKAKERGEGEGKPTLARLQSVYRRTYHAMREINADLIEESKKQRAGVYLRKVLTRIRNDLKSANSILKQTEPAALCEECEGLGCKKCMEAGFITSLAHSKLKKKE